MSLLNGLSQMGAAVSQFAGNAGLEAQKVEAEKQAQQLADQLMTQREHVGRVETGQIQEAAEGRRQTFETSRDTARFAHEDTAEDKRIKAQKDIAGMQLEAGRYQAIPVQRLDEDGNPVQGYLNYNTRTGKADFVEGTVPVPKYNQMTPNQANDNARKDWNYWVKKDKDNNGDGTVRNLDGSVADQFSWITNRAEKYRTGKIAAPQSDGGQIQSSASPTASPQAPAHPPVPLGLVGAVGVQWSPTQKVFRTPDGRTYDVNGNPVGGPIPSARS